jgi:hypothetical protein
VTILPAWSCNIVKNVFTNIFETPTGQMTPRTLFVFQRKKISKIKTLIFKKLGYTSTEKLEPHYFVGAEPYYDGAPALLLRKLQQLWF